MSNSTDTEDTGTEDLLRAELRAIAARAPHAGEVRVALARAQQRRRRPPNLMLAAVAAAVVLVALAVPVVLNAAGPSTSDVAAPPASSAACCRALEYDVTWLPEGLVERERAAGPDGAVQTRRWAVTNWEEDENLVMPEVLLETYSPDKAPWSEMSAKIARSPDTFEMDGRIGSVDTASDTTAQFTWITESGRVARLKLDNVTDARETGLRIAASVRPDEQARTTARIAFGPLPAGTVDASAKVWGFSPLDGRTELTATQAVEPRLELIRASLDPARPPMAAARPVPLDSAASGATTAYVWERQVQIPLGDGSMLTVSSLSSETEEQLLAIAAGISVDRGVDQSWIGSP
ncbi:hypothetical protein CFN78_25295 [Amycolatopsis antarctica]|uniref:Uncharacterized protein n=1 Tax=Amycolatopsis antarctica TaxID=1854586 RepID=A0A263CYI9_9PSEU|nr:hypothetical protein [Amycolatopsis antarctica]OZM70477.1 hypothetical protein CFN78_25295 [Amycolatopsis antarctica]